MFLVNKSRQE